MSTSTGLQDSYATKDLSFFGEHPQYDVSHGPRIRGIYRNCQHAKVKGKLRVSLEDAHDHIKTCDRCKENLRLMSIEDKQFIK